MTTISQVLLPYFECSARWNRLKFRSEISQVHFRILNSVLAGINYKYDQKVSKFTSLFHSVLWNWQVRYGSSNTHSELFVRWKSLTLLALEPTTNPIRNFASSLLHSESSSRWNCSAFWNLRCLEPTTNTIRKLASSLPYSTLHAETDKSIR